MTYTLLLSQFFILPIDVIKIIIYCQIFLN
nr:MAG TPA: hypothetical protein [Caudoviricetes sp.]DAM53935.1 MAG TPA: hypothetical protein [Caudoviricetes sp.]DAN89088.1 MAG TPA: hypothetical protein [Caudoviricetes sp.]DAT87255.1 MAG TPA: hypothetical protein [Caudoviricetes sp.]DAX44825.1 MAG TPA: hypothetical protein [Caudoviricetes sp.]